jgi:hypothetical protein
MAGELEAEADPPDPENLGHIDENVVSDTFIIRDVLTNFFASQGSVPWWCSYMYTGKSNVLD